MNKLWLLETVYRRPIQIFDELNKRATFRQFVATKFSHARELPEQRDWDKNRFSLYEYLNQEEIRGSAIDYLEFGVWEGASLRRWVSLNTNPDSRFYGFDSFQGLPSDWNDLAKKGTFDKQGQTPIIADARVRLQKGWFHDTLPGFLESFQPEHRVVVHIDCDIYASTLFVLTCLNRWLVPSSIVVFDEFYIVQHEYAAWRDFSQAYWRDARALCFTPGYKQVALVME